jgi:hypothetical protein
MATRAIFTPYSAEFPATNFPELGLINRRPVLGYDATTNETCYWTTAVPQGITGTMTFIISIMMASAITGNTDWDVAVEAVTSGDATDLDAGTSFDTVNSTDNTTVPGTAGYMQQITVTLTNNDSLAAADYVRFSLTRDAVSDTAAGDAYFLGAEFRDAA